MLCLIWRTAGTYPVQHFSRAPRSFQRCSRAPAYGHHCGVAGDPRICIVKSTQSCRFPTKEMRETSLRSRACQQVGGSFDRNTRGASVDSYTGFVSAFELWRRSQISLLLLLGTDVI